MKTYQYKTSPWKHQRDSLRKAWGKPGFAYLMEMGTGKSKVMVDEASAYYENEMITGWVVMAPKGVYRNWTRPGGEIDAHMPDRVREKAVIAVWEPGGGNKANQEQLSRALRPGDGLRVLVINTESIQQPGAARKYLEKFLESHVCKFDLDESTYIKNAGAARTQYLVGGKKGWSGVARLAAYRRIATGLVTPKSPLDLFPQYEFLERGLLGHRNFYSFRARYAVMDSMNYGGRRVNVVVGYRNVEDLSEIIEPYSYRVRKEECLDLPPKVYVRRDVELTHQQETAYAQMRDDAVAILSETEFLTADLVITQMLRLQQIVCGHVPDDDGNVHHIDTNRVNALMETVEETDGKVVVWTRFRDDISQIVEALTREYDSGAVAQYHGGNTPTRSKDVERFLHDPRCRFMVSNQQSGGYGNTWNVADLVVYYSNDFSLERRMQSEDRTHRGEMKHSVTYVDLLAPNTVDEKIVRALRSGLDVAASVMGEDPRDWVI